MQDPALGASVGQTLVRQLESRASEQSEREASRTVSLFTRRRSSRTSCWSSDALRTVTSRVTTTFGAQPSHPRAVERGGPEIRGDGHAPGALDEIPKTVVVAPLRRAAVVMGIRQGCREATSNPGLLWRQQGTMKLCSVCAAARMQGLATAAGPRTTSSGGRTTERPTRSVERKMLGSRPEGVCWRAIGPSSIGLKGATFEQQRRCSCASTCLRLVRQPAPRLSERAGYVPWNMSAVRRAIRKAPGCSLIAAARSFTESTESRGVEPHRISQFAFCPGRHRAIPAPGTGGLLVSIEDCRRATTHPLN
jgi:hypothetical protein